MHMHVIGKMSMFSHMRTTIELSDEQRAELLRLAAERGEKGFSRLIQEAVEEYLASRRARVEQVAAARSVLGTAGDDWGTHLDQTLQSSRGSWR
jgi:metal-responsive CopG/Arc/MetJ family transcriptional regulator